jgi:anaerobic C4-dicarboxylate transporter
MKKLLIICAVLMLCSCASIKRVDWKPVYQKELKEGKITRSDYNYLMQGQKELNKMNKDR